MAYVSDQLNLLVPHVGQGPGLWHYISDDVHGDVDAADWFSDGDAKGMRVGDNVLVNDNTTPFGATLHQVTVVTTGGAASLGAALFT
jgi:hypothetical protein